MTVIPFPRAPEEEGEADTPHLSGEAICAGCGAEWVAVAPTDVRWFECPVCHAAKGLYKYFVYPPEDELIFVCQSCEGTLFVFAQDYSAICAGCGARHWPFSDENMPD